MFNYMKHYGEDNEKFIRGEKFVSIIFVGVIILLTTAVGFLLWKNHTITNRIDAQEKAIKEIASVVIQSGLIVPDEDGKPQVNTLLIEAWKQVNQMPQ